MTSSDPRRKPQSALLHLLPSVALTLLCALRPARADVVLLIEEPINLLGHIASTGHTSLLLTTLCSDDHLSLRPCRSGEPGTVIGRYQGLADKHDWLALDPSAYLYATSALAAVPAFATPEQAEALRQSYNVAHPSLNAFQTSGGIEVQLLGQSYRRTIFCLRVHTSPEQDARLLDWLNRNPNRSRYNFLYSNCADLVRRMLDVLFPGMVRRNLLFDAGMTTPKQLASSLHHYAGKHPELGFNVELLPQVPGTIHRSGTVKGVTESFVKTTPYLMTLIYLNPLPFGGVIASGLLDRRYNPQKQATTAPAFDTRELFATSAEQQIHEKTLKLATQDPRLKTEQNSN